MISAFAPAKVNLYLHILGRRDDGYHELDSLVMFADVGDRIEAREADGLSLAVSGRFAPALAGEPPEGNLVLRAARLLAQRCGRPAAAALHLEKNLPVASGIGGGSADAAACLRALSALWNVALPEAELVALAAGLGADVPVCLASRSAYFGGVGEIITPAPDLPGCPAVLVNPGVPLPTPAVFKARRGPFSAPGRLESVPEDAVALTRSLALRHNDLTAAAIAVVPAVATVLEALQATAGCLLARLSGSGATCFALYADAAGATAAGAALSAAHPGWWVAPCRLGRAAPG